LPALRHNLHLSAIHLNDLNTARKALHALQADLPPTDTAAQRQVRLLAAELHLTARQAQAALDILGPTTAKNDARPELLLRTQALLATGQTGDISATLHTWVTTHPRDATAWQLLAQVWQQQGQPLRARRAEAEAHVARYDYAAAIDRFKAGQALARSLLRSNTPEKYDHMEASIIDTRLRAVEALLKEQTDDTRERHQ